jgi:hypothetical protein
MGEDIKPGTPVIINYFDRPCARLIAVVERVEAGVVHALYLCMATRGERCSSNIENVTSIYDFGVGLIVNEAGVASAKEVGESSARYPDGRKRVWQPDTYNDIGGPVRVTAHNLLMIGAQQKEKP